MNKERLLTIATFLDNLPPEKFNFDRYVTKHENGCGTVCCAIGWFPQIFPEIWIWKPIGRNILHPGTFRLEKSFSTTLEEFLDLSIFQLQRLFYPNRFLPPDITPNQLATQIRSFVESGGKI
jgi:hypothetical protein